MSASGIVRSSCPPSMGNECMAIEESSICTVMWLIQLSLLIYILSKVISSMLDTPPGPTTVL